MARTPKSANNIQVFRGSLPPADVFAQNAGAECCGGGTTVEHDKLGARTRFSNALAHSNPLGANDKYQLPYGPGFAGDKTRIVNHINAIGVGATISVLAIPTYAFVTGVAVHIAAEEPGLTFNLITRNGLELPLTQVLTVEAAVGTAACEVERTLIDNSGEDAAEAFEGFGALDGNLFIDIFGRDGQGEFSLEADELILQVATMPAGGVINGTFDITVSVSYEVIHRAEK